MVPCGAHFGWTESGVLGNLNNRFSILQSNEETHVSVPLLQKNSPQPLDRENIVN